MDVQKAPIRRARRRVFVISTIAALLIALAFGARAIPRAVPSVERATVSIGDVKRGPLVREVLGPGTLVPVEIRWLTARSNGQVEEILQKPGSPVGTQTIVARLVNSELELAALEAEQEVSRAQSELALLRATRGAEHLAQRSTIATLTSEVADAERRARADDKLAERGFLSKLEQEQTLSRESELQRRLDFENKRLGALGQGIAAQVSAMQAQIAQLRSIAEFKRGEVAALTLRAGIDGVLSELTLEPGQWVTAGTPLGKVVKPDRLKAELRIPETQAQDLKLGQQATIDIHGAVVSGKVVRIDPAAQAGNVRVDVTLEGALPQGARPDLNVRGTIELERLDNVLFVDRPAQTAPGTQASLFKVTADASGATRAQVLLGRSSVQCVEVVRGLKEGDRVILSELSEFDEADRIRLR